MMWAISRCSTKHALRIPWLVHAPTKHFMLSANLKEAQRSEPELFRRLERLTRQTDYPSGTQIFSQLQEQKTTGPNEWGVHIVLEGSVVITRGREEYNRSNSTKDVVTSTWMG